MHGAVSEIEIEKIDVEGQLVRHDIDQDHVWELATSMRTHGLLQPIVVRERGDKYELIAGRHRLEAAKLLGWKTIKAHIIETSYEKKLLATLENVTRKQMNIEEEAEAVKYLHDQEKLSVNQIADLLGKSRDWVLQRLAYFRYPQDVKEELLEGRISIKHAEIIAKFSDERIRAILLNATIQQKLTVRQLRQVAEYYESYIANAEAIEEAIEQAKIAQIERASAKKLCTICERAIEIAETVWIEICRECFTEIQRIKAKQKETKQREEEGWR